MLARLLQRVPTILVSPGAAPVADLRENVSAAAVALHEAARLDAIGAVTADLGAAMRPGRR